MSLKMRVGGRMTKDTRDLCIAASLFIICIGMVTFILFVV